MKKISMISAAAAAALAFAPAANAQVQQRLDVKIDKKSSNVKVKKGAAVALSVSTGTLPDTQPAPGTHNPITYAKINLPKEVKLNYKKFKACKGEDASKCKSNTQVGKGTAKAWVNGFDYQPEGKLTQYIGAGGKLLIRTVFTKPAQIDETLVGKVSLKGGAYSFDFNVPEILQVPLPPDGVEQLVDFNTNFDKKTTKSGKKKIALVEITKCPAGGLKFTGEFKYRDGQTANAETTVSCSGGKKKKK